MSSDASPNIAGFCNPALDARILTNDPATVAAADRTLTDAAPAISLFSPRYIDLVSRRLDGYAYHEVFHWLIDQADVVAPP